VQYTTPNKLVIPNWKDGQRSILPFVEPTRHLLSLYIYISFVHSAGPFIPVDGSEEIEWRGSGVWRSGGAAGCDRRCHKAIELGWHDTRLASTTGSVELGLRLAGVESSSSATHGSRQRSVGVGRAATPLMEAGDEVELERWSSVSAAPTSAAACLSSEAPWEDRWRERRRMCWNFKLGMTYLN
jgi:hypothetical protein